MINKQSMTVESWDAKGRLTFKVAALIVVCLALLPFYADGQIIDKVTMLMIYIVLAMMWNLLAGFAGLVSVGQQAFFGLGAYFAIRLVMADMNPYGAFIIGSLAVAVIAYLISFFVLNLKGGEFAIAMWVIAEVIRIFVMFDPIIQGETGTSLLAMNAYEPELRRSLNFWFSLSVFVVFSGGVLVLLKSRLGAAAQAIRDDEEAARSVGIKVESTKRIIFVIAAVGCAFAGCIWLSTAITFQPRTNFGVQWTVFMLFMVLVGGLGTFEGPIIGAILFFILQEVFGDFGAWYLAGLGAVAVLFALYLPKGIWGELQARKGVSLIQTGVKLVRRSKP
ncbi:branched-chain amino acid ABC transporter permease [Marinomonas mediterranea]|uniref:branched-chain amino acid ABC transporter permease n=1 Tax=Marinomonas mediterranea TaxID=119864 RepID=UPI00234B93F0|nr:branched-chain amino acid ABC transporter permease [Marinomonas mediterranea]WCN10842.1 branched-chain amino acid ABC transporter permease [Marinomonas mediterranea]WCN14899.1 branched-chain amino acid ABC transporter permease [Marinomonas mediterranea]